LTNNKTGFLPETLDLHMNISVFTARPPSRLKPGGAAILSANTLF
jgi:hypothetical protein